MHDGFPRPESSPAGLFEHFRIDRGRLAAEAATALGHVAEIQRAQPDVRGWITFFLANQSGDQNDMRLADYSGQCRRTALARSLPYTMEIVDRLRDEGFRFQYCRIAVLEKRSTLRCHVDMYTSSRLIVPLTEQGTDFRHVFRKRCFAMGAGELWGIDGNVCHGAAHVGAAGHRVALLLDAQSDPADLPAWWKTPWSIPVNRFIPRSCWDRAARELKIAEARRALAEGTMPSDVENHWLLLPFEFELTPEAAYEELIDFCVHNGCLAGESDRDFWANRAEYWKQRNCRCA